MSAPKASSQQAARLLRQHIDALEQDLEAGKVADLSDNELDAALSEMNLPTAPARPSFLQAPEEQSEDPPPVSHRPHPVQSPRRTYQKAARFKGWKAWAGVFVLVAALGIAGVVQLRHEGATQYLALSPVANLVEIARASLNRGPDTETAGAFDSAVGLLEEASSAGIASNSAGVDDAIEQLRSIYAALESQTEGPDPAAELRQVQGVVALLLAKAALSEGDEDSAREWLEAARTVGDAETRAQAEELADSAQL
ncbi:MAG: hypothetical protein AAFN13_03635 [Bacteroidota bacterium]